jgi:type II secretory pathway component PulF
MFAYKAKDRAGAGVAGTIEAESRSAVAMRLQAMGLFPVDIQGQQAADGSLGWLGQLGRARVRSMDLTNFYMQMSDLIGAGVPLVKALSIVKNQTPNPALTQILAQVNADVQEGATFAKALERHPKQFNNLTVALVRAGEAGGLLDQSLLRVSEYAEAEDELKSKVKAAMVYPAFMLVLGTIAIIVLMSLLPKIMVVFDEMHQTLPAITRIVQKVSYFMANYWPVMGATLVAGFFLARRYVRTDRGAMQFHRFLLKVPALGQLLLKREVAAFTRTLGSLLRNGVPILSAIDISSEVLGMRPIRDDVKKIPDSVTQGTGVAAALRESEMFPSVVVNMVAVGEETGQLPEVLLRVAHSYETQVDREVKTLTSILEPTIIVCLGVVVAIVVMAMLLPIMTIDPSKGL